jgi:pyrroline-5-carboxylate reductase
MKHITFIGAGNMARALVQGLLNQGWPLHGITVVCRDRKKHSDLAGRGLEVSTDRQASAARADLVVLATKPQQMTDAVADLADALSGKCVVSVAAGITTRWLADRLPGSDLVRAMPNTPAAIRQGMTGLYAESAARQRHEMDVEELFGSVGEWVWLDDETLMDTVTALAGSGPAYLFRFTEALIEAGRACGLDESAARHLAVQTMFGAAHLMKHSDAPISRLRQQVTSPGGTTEAALRVLEAGGLDRLVIEAVRRAAERGKELSTSIEPKP